MGVNPAANAIRECTAPMLQVRVNVGQETEPVHFTGTESSHAAPVLKPVAGAMPRVLHAKGSPEGRDAGDGDGARLAGPLLWHGIGRAHVRAKCKTSIILASSIGESDI